MLGILYMLGLSLACAVEYEDAVKTLLEEDKVGVNSKDTAVGLKSLSWAVLMGYGEVVRRLLGEAKLDWSCNRSIPLSLAIGKAETRIVRLLVEKGVESNFTYDDVSQSD